MSKTHYIQTEIHFTISAFIDLIAQHIKHVEYEQRGENLCYLWFSKTSTRGVDISLENGIVELCNTSLSNYADFQLTNVLAESICKVFKGAFYKEYENEEDQDEENDSEYVLKLVPSNLPVYTDTQIEEIQQEDTNVMRVMITQLKKHMTVFGPKRKTHFGEDFMESFKDKTIEELTIIMHNYIQNVNYDFPNYDYGDVMEMGEGEDAKILKLITNRVDCIIDKYDYVLFSKNENEIIAITNDTLNTILPPSWQRIDEYTIVAPILPKSDFQKLVAQAEKLNQYNELRK